MAIFGLMETHKFHVGQRVTYVGPSYTRGTAIEYEVVRLLPPEAGQRLYRVKSANEPHERVVGEEQITARRLF
jgi:hypothetical protein